MSNSKTKIDKETQTVIPEGRLMIILSASDDIKTKRYDALLAMKLWIKKQEKEEEQALIDNYHKQLQKGKRKATTLAELGTIYVHSDKQIKIEKDEENTFKKPYPMDIEPIPSTSKQAYNK